MPDQLPEQTQAPAPPAPLFLQSKIYFLSSITTGIITTGLFNPIDRGLYLALIKERSFLSAENFQAPYQGSLLAMVQKCIFGSLYFIGQDYMKQHLHPYLHKVLKTSELTANLSVGLVAGSFNGILSNPMSAVKYRNWGKDDSKYGQTAKEMWQGGKLKPFIIGTRATVYRELASGGFYEIMRNALLKSFAPQNSTQDNSGGLMTVSFACNTFSSILATSIASPFNYARNMQYKVPLEDLNKKLPNVKEILLGVRQAAKKQPPTFIGQAGFFAGELQLGWGTARAGLGMAATQTIFDESKKVYTARLTPQKRY